MHRFTYMVLGFLMTATASATHAKSGVSSCATDQYTVERINEFPKERQLPIRNNSGHYVGAFILVEGGGPSDIGALYLCGNNSGYYYADGNLADYASELVGGKKSISFYNDEYTAYGEVETVVRGNESATLLITLHVQFVGEPESADYGPFTTALMVDVPL